MAHLATQKVLRDQDGQPIDVKEITDGLGIISEAPVILTTNFTRKCRQSLAATVSDVDGIPSRRRTPSCQITATTRIGQIDFPRVAIIIDVIT